MTQPREPSAAPGARTWPGGRGDAYGLGVLTLCCALNFFDRQVINILAEPIKLEFGLSDTQLGLLTGLTFAVFHATLTLPLAHLADRSNRILVIAASMAVWSAATVASGLMTGFLALAAARMVVGIGEAGGVAPAHSWIADTVPKRRRATALAVYSAGIPLGGLLGMALGGLFLDGYGWRAAFVVAGVPGLILAPMMVLTLRDPVRMAARPPQPSLGGVCREILSKHAFLLLTGAAAASAFVSFGQAAFIAGFFFRVHGAALAALAPDINHLVGTALGAAGLLGLALGLAKGLTGVLGSIAGGWLTDRDGDDSSARYLTVPALTALARIPIIVAAVLVPDAIAAFTLLALSFFLGGAGGVGGFAAVQTLVAPAMRSTAAALYSIGINLVGLGLGPLTVGVMSDALADAGLGVAEGLRWSLVLSTAPLLLVAVLNRWALRPFAAESVG